MPKPTHFPDIEDRLRLFIACVERGQTVPDWLLQFMAEGAREFLRGGKPWQKGKGGRRPKPFTEDAVRRYLLAFYGRLSAPQIAMALGLLDEAGKDKTRTVARDVAKRGPIAFFAFKINRRDDLRAIFGDLMALDYQDLPTATRRDCIAGLKRGLADLERDEREPGYA